MQIHKKDTQDDEDVPDKFLDPITYSLIEEPCLLPNMNGDLENQFFDKTTVMKQLLIKEENPYTRDKLTIDNFKDYNKQSEVQEKIKLFLEEYEEWKKSLKK